MVDWSTTVQLLEPVENIPPAEAEQKYYAQRDMLDMVAWKEENGLWQKIGTIHFKESLLMKHSNILASIFILMMASAAHSQSCEELMRNNTNCMDSDIGSLCKTYFDIAKADIGSRDADRGGTATYTAPKGFQILGSRLQVDREKHSGVSAGKMIQSGQISFQNEAMANLVEDTSSSILKGALSFGGKKGDAFGQAEFEDFQKELRARFVFLTDTNSSVPFKWFVDSKSGDHGAAITACAEISLIRYPTGDELAAVKIALNFAAKTNSGENVLEIIDRVSQAKQ